MPQFRDEPGSDQLSVWELLCCGFAASGTAIAFVHCTRPLPRSAEHSFVARPSENAQRARKVILRAAWVER